MTPHVETRTLTVNPNIIQHLIRSQAGSFGKAVVESIMNSMDAGATAIRIEVDSAGYSITDDGHGLRTREEVLKCFEVFGFVHDDRQRDWGRFGLGRAQAFNWATNVWRTRSFKLEVDIRARGLDYTLTENLPDVPGLRIDGLFYEPMSEVDKLTLQREVETLCRYVQVPVFFNGREVQRDVTKQKWTHEDESFYLKTSESSTLAVYSQGVFVRDYPSRQLGVGGVLVTKLGHPLELNMSRSDVLTHQCKLWATICKVLKGLGTDEAAKSSKKSRLTDEQRDFLAAESADPDNVKHLLEKLIQLSNGRFISPKVMADSLWRSSVILTVAEQGHPLADVALQEKSAVVVTPRTLTRFGVETVRELATVLATRMAAGNDHVLRSAAHSLRYAIQAGRMHENFDESPVFSRLDASTVPETQWTKGERAVIAAVASPAAQIAFLVRKQLVNNDLLPADQLYKGKTRRLCVGQSANAEAFTDGSTYVAIDREVLESTFKGGIGELHRLLAVIVHEYIHESSSEGTHLHDQAFYAVFHDVMIEEAVAIHAMASTAFRTMVASRERLNRKQAKALDETASAAAA